MASGVELLRAIELNTVGGLAVTSGQIPGYSVVDKFGENPVVTTETDPEDIWEGGGLYIYDTPGTAPIVSIASSIGTDTQDIDIEGLDINGNEVKQTITLTGSVRAALTTPLWRVFRAENQGTTDLAGTVFVYTGTGTVPTIGDPKIRALIDNGNNQTLMAIYTIPLGKVGFLYEGELGLNYTGSVGAGTNFARAYYMSRRLAKVFKIKKSISLISAASSNYQNPRQFPDPIPALTDIKLTVAEVSETMGVWGTFCILLIDEELLEPDFLVSIGQPSSVT